jgi:hypothetical protein
MRRKYGEREEQEEDKPVSSAGTEYSAVAIPNTMTWGGS